MGTGRKRIEIQPIHDMARRRVTLTKRRQGLFKKMGKLRTLTGCAAAAIVFSTAGRPYTYGDLSLLDSFTGSIICSGGEGSSSANYGHGGGEGHEVLEAEGLDGFTESLISSGGDGGPSTSYGGGDGMGIIKEATDLDGCYGGEDGVGMIREATDLDGLMVEMNSLLEMRRKVVERLNQQVDHVGGFDAYCRASTEHC